MGIGRAVLVQAGLVVIGALVAAAVPVGAGFLLDRTGYAGMLCGLALAMGGVFVFALRGSGAIGRTTAPG